MAQSGLNYPEYIADWFIEPNLRVGNPEVIANAEVDGTTVSVSGTVKDPDGSITSVDTALLKADVEGLFQRIDEHGGISFNSADGSYSDRYNGLNDGFYKAQVTATDNATRTATRVTPEVKVGNPDPLHPCQDFTDNNFNHVQQGRALQCNFGFTCAKGSGDNLGLFNTFITTTVAEVQPGFFREGACPR
jgi:poly(3-hydroxybutyrate) depolymerase